jgi:methionyl-tRNA formyltransferase
VVASPVKQAAVAAGVPVIQPNTLREPDAMAQLHAWVPDVIVVVAFGQILKPAVLGLPAQGCVNVHASLLPRHRGAAPISAAILAGDAETGVTIMQMNVGLDTGPMLAHRAEAIRPSDTTQTLTERLAHAGAELLIETLPAYLSNQITPQPQDNAHATYAPQLKKEDGHLDFTRPAAELERQVRAVTPWPGAFALWHDQPIKILEAQVDETVQGDAGLILQTARGLTVACGVGGLALARLQPPGKKPMPATDFARGARNFVGTRLK